jgi:ABC-2 type transport system permease protein
MTWRLIALYLRALMLNEVQYRANFLLRIVHSVLSLGTAVISLALVFGQVQRLDGWSLDQLLVLTGVYTTLSGFTQMLVLPNALTLLADIEEGTLDTVLLKPADAQLAVSLRSTQVWQGLDIVIGIGLTAAGLALSGPVRPSVLPAFVLALVCAGALIYGFVMAIAISAFWLVKLDNVGELFSGVFQAARWPIGVYPGWMRAALTFVVPVGLAVTVPAEVLTGRTAAAGLFAMTLLAAASLAATRALWRRGLRRYSGASA